MTPLQRKRIVDRHSDSLLRFGYHPNALYWSSKEIQEIRFQVLAEIGVCSDDSVLDVGCGFADLYPWFLAQGVKVNYTGVDISPHLIDVAREKHPCLTLLVGELQEVAIKDDSVDWVLLSGALNESYQDDGKYAKAVIALMYLKCRKGVAFNLLNAEVVKAHDLQSFDTGAIFRYCQTLCPEVTLRTDYLTNDFTIYMRKSL